MNRAIPFLCLLLIATATLTAQNFTDEREITVHGEATVKVVPDEVIIRMGVEERNPDLGAARDAADGTIARMMEFAQSLGIEKKHIQTDYIYVNPQYDYKNENMILIGYIVRKNFVVTLKDLSKFDALITGALELGVNAVHDVNFRTTELRKYRDQARDLAVKAAKEKAEAMAGALGSRVGLPTNISEQDTRWWGWYNSGWGQGRYDRGMTQNVMQNAGGDMPEGETLSPGQIAVDARVTVTFMLAQN